MDQLVSSQNLQMLLYIITAASVSVSHICNSFQVFDSLSRSSKNGKHFSVIIILNNKNENLLKCVAAIKATGYKNFDITIIDNNSRNKEIGALSQVIVAPKAKKNEINIVKKRKKILASIIADSYLDNAKKKNSKKATVIMKTPVKVEPDFFHSANTILRKSKKIEFVIPTSRIHSLTKFTDIGNTFNNILFSTDQLELINTDLNIESQSVLICRKVSKRIKSPTYVISKKVLINSASNRSMQLKINQLNQKLNIQDYINYAIKFCFLMFPILAITLNQPNMIIIGWFAYTLNLAFNIIETKTIDVTSKIEYLKHVTIGYLLFIFDQVRIIHKFILGNFDTKV